MLKTCRLSALLFLQCLCLYSLTNYGGVRSPDSEIVFRSAEALARDGSLAINLELESWPGFGVAQGIDQRLYSIYPPGEMVTLSLAIPLADYLANTDTFQTLQAPLSHYLGDALERSLAGETGSSSTPHRIRFLTSIGDITISALGVVVFWLILLRMTASRSAAYLTATTYAFATPVWSYAGSFFSEPLAALFLLSSFRLLLTTGTRLAFLSGLLIGLATASHLTAILFAPFFSFYRFGIPRTRTAFLEFLSWLTGLSTVLGMLGLYNLVRFGSCFESGRGLSIDNKVHFVPLLSGTSIENLVNLLISPGKGLLLICPATLLGILAWRYLYQADRRLSVTLSICLIFRLCFIALYYDWHAGFGLGPRYLYLILPFLLLPCAFWIRRHTCDIRSLSIAVAALCACIIQQWYFALGEIFSFYHQINRSQDALGIDVFYRDRLYTEWQYSPIVHLLDYQRGPFLLKQVPLSNFQLWLAGSAIWVLIAVIVIFFIQNQRSTRARSNSDVAC